MARAAALARKYARVRGRVDRCRERVRLRRRKLEASWEELRELERAEGVVKAELAAARVAEIGAAAVARRRRGGPVPGDAERAGDGDA